MARACRRRGRGSSRLQLLQALAVDGHQHDVLRLRLVAAQLEAQVHRVQLGRVQRVALLQHGAERRAQHAGHHHQPQPRAAALPGHGSSLDQLAGADPVHAEAEPELPTDNHRGSRGSSRWPRPGRSRLRPSAPVSISPRRSAHPARSRLEVIGDADGVPVDGQPSIALRVARPPSPRVHPVDAGDGSDQARGLCRRLVHVGGIEALFPEGEGEAPAPSPGWSAVRKTDTVGMVPIFAGLTFSAPMVGAGKLPVRSPPAGPVDGPVGPHRSGRTLGPRGPADPASTRARQGALGRGECLLGALVGLLARA